MEWQQIMQPIMQEPFYQQLEAFLVEEYQQQTIYPPKQAIFTAFELTPFEQVKVVLLGQDPYHNKGQAQGLSFSVPKGMKIPPSLVNIYQELETDLGVQNTTGDLTSWAKQGVLLLNTVLTVRAHQAGSHQGHGWEKFTDQIILSLNDHKTPIVFLLFGKQAMQKQRLIDQSKHYIITAPHPSPLSAYRGFFGSQVFSKTNEILADNNLTPINWQID